MAPPARNAPIVLSFAQEGLAPGDFLPLVPRGRVKLAVQDIARMLPTHLDLGATLSLEPGTWDLPLILGESFPVDIPRGSTCKVQLTAGKPLGPASASEGARTLVTGLSLSFDPPVVLHNIVPILGHLPQIFEDRQLRGLLDRFEESRVRKVASAGVHRVGRALKERFGPRVSSYMPEPGTVNAAREQLGERLRKGAEQVSVVILRHAAARPVLRNGEWQLDFRFSGHIRTFGRGDIAFTELHVPHFIIPYPHALLDKLVSDEPLASARLLDERLRARAMAELFAQIIRSFEGRLSFRGRLPALGLDLGLLDGGRVEGVASLDRELEIRTRFTGLVKESALEFGLQETELRDVGAGREGARLNARATLRLEPATPPDQPLSLLYLRSYAQNSQTSSDRVLATLEIAEGSSLSALEFSGSATHPLLQGEMALHLHLVELRVEGKTAIALDPSLSGLDDQNSEVNLRFSTRLSIPEGTRFDDGRTRLDLTLPEASFGGQITTPTPGKLELTVQGGLDFDLASLTEIGPFAELSLDEGMLRSGLKGRASLEGHVLLGWRGSESLEADFSGTRLSASLGAVRATLDDRSLTIPEGASFRLQLSDTVLASTGLGRASLDLDYDLGGRSPILEAPGRSVELFVPELRRGDFTINLSPAGGLNISGPERGLYDARYFNALINPEQETGRWMEILENDQAIDRVIDVIGCFSQDGADLLETVRRVARRFRQAIKAEAIEEIGDALPGRKLARLFSRLLTGWDLPEGLAPKAGSPELEDRLFDLVKSVTDGTGLNVAATKQLLADALPEHDYEFEIDRVVRWAARLLGPTEPVKPQKLMNLASLSEEPRYNRLYQALPTAAELYRVVDGAEPMDPRFSPTVARVAPYLTLEQVEYLLARRVGDWRPKDLLRLRYVAELKRRVQLIAQGYGGLGYAPQALAIAFFLPEPVAITRAGPDPEESSFFDKDCPVPFCMLGPQEVAVLLQAGLASAMQTRAVQLNQRLLLDMMASLPPSFSLGVLLEMGGRGAWVLAGVLNALLGMTQSSVSVPLDLVRFFSERTGIEFPKLDDYMAGGKWARMSYFEALSRTAEQILSVAEPYHALVARLQVARHPAPVAPSGIVAPSEQILAAQQAIAQADLLGARCTFKGKEPVRRKQAKEAYFKAFNICRDLVAQDPLAFQQPWFKEFWGRNHESLVVLSVVREIQGDVDESRRWFETRAQAPRPTDEQALLEGVIDVLYHEPLDRARLKADPLVRLLIDPPDGKYDFTIVSCMGVVTEGERGTELEETFQRLAEKRDVRLVRADTATARSLDFNARRVEAAIRTVKGPFGMVGYSQGCANALQAESSLLGGTPEQQALMRDYRCRNLIFSAANGSAHGTCGDLKFQWAMVDAEKFLSLYQALFSRRAIETALFAVRIGMDSRAFVQSMWGVYSLSAQGVLTLGQEGQFVPSAPTSTVRAVVRPEILPEALEFLAHVLTKQVEHERHDTQVILEEAVGHPVFVRNPQADLLARCDMGSLPQISHHWSPLLRETSFITTQRDRERAIYQFPKDRHIFPWIEVNARFGVIPVKP